ncbi:ImmA/IrrE family metallo-endopeptidase [Deinococcus aestuarii]|uniref:ImmA/IrrE family metallo-endopeptidase n=1 Tax=Deinococcus aestuarii TaxID=2774531 RepID=UPI001C0DBF1B|nr:ImmA/IrrE family metallo-endopeptidase [Deinococcus aestuarii]
MLTPRTRQWARQRGTAAAAAAHERLGTDTGQRVDVFGIIQRSGVWLMFQPLDVYGVYRRIPDEAGDISGILVNAKHPPSLQRFTAAHEYGHHDMGHEESVDGEVELGLARDRTTDSVIEVEAQAFAANFLMPPRLVYTMCRAAGLPRENADPTPQQVYLMGLEMGASYQATVTQLRALDVIGKRVYDQLVRISPLQVKTELRGGERPDNGRVDVWPLDRRDSGRVVYPRVSDELVLHLPEMPSTGYVWTAPETVGAQPADPAVEVLVDQFLAEPGPDDEVLGGEGLRRFVLRVTHQGGARLELRKQRPWQRSGEPLDRFGLDLNIAPHPAGSAQQGVSTRQQPFLA